MATPTPTPQTGFSVPSAPPRPRLVCTGKITSIGDVKTTNSGDYEMLDIIFTPTRGSRKVFPRLMFREEMFSVNGFDVKGYLDYNRYPQLATANQRGGTIGQSYAAVYGLNINKKEPKGKNAPDDITPLMAIAGGREALNTRLVPLLLEKLNEPGREVGAFGVTQLTAQEIHEILKTYIATNNVAGIEQAVVLKQSTDMDGELNDNYEVQSWLGVFDSDANERIQKRIEAANAKAKTVSQQLKQGYTL